MQKSRAPEGTRLSLSKKSPERVAFLCMIWYNKKGDENAAKGKKGKKSA